MVRTFDDTLMSVCTCHMCDRLYTDLTYKSLLPWYQSWYPSVEEMDVKCL